MRIAVCDDNDIDRNLIIDLLKQSIRRHNLTVDMETYSSGMNLFDDVQDGAWFDALFLDIYMEKTTGMEVAHKLRELGYKGQIVFITASPDFAIEGYDVYATSYILKPVSVDKLDRIIKRIASDVDEATYTVNFRSTVVRVPLDEILYVESSNTKCILHRKDGNDYNIYKRLDEIEQELNDKRFLRCHRSYLVNMDYIRQMDKQFYLTTGDMVLIRQRSLKAVREAYMNYMDMRDPEAQAKQ